MRINKYISHNTKHSRREADELIKQGLVKLNNKVITDLSTQIEEDDKVKIKDKPVFKKTKFSMIVYNKPKGEIVSKKDDRGRKTIYDSLPKKFAHYLSVGRLDFASEGLLLLTDAPAIATALMKSDMERMYYLKIKGEVSEAMITAMKEGLVAADATKGAHEKSKIRSMEFAPFLAYKVMQSSGGYTKLKVIINEGKNRELRRFFGYFDADVVDLKRVSFGRMSLDNLKSGKYRYLENNEYEDLRDFLKQSGVRY